MHCLSVYTILCIKNIVPFNNLYGGLRTVVITFYLYSTCQIIKEFLMLTPTIRINFQQLAFRITFSNSF